MTTVRVTLCSCGGVPEFTVYRGGEDFMEAKGICPKCGLESDPIEHTWGGMEARLMAVDEWNRMRAEEPDKKPVMPCPDCEGVGGAIIETAEGPQFGEGCKRCKGRGAIEKDITEKGRSDVR